MVPLRVVEGVQRGSPPQADAEGLGVPPQLPQNPPLPKGDRGGLARRLKTSWGFAVYYLGACPSKLSFVFMEGSNI